MTMIFVIITNCQNQINVPSLYFGSGRHRIGNGPNEVFFSAPKIFTTGGKSKMAMVGRPKDDWQSHRDEIVQMT